MKVTGSYARWTHPESEMPESFCRLSYGLFQTAFRDGTILGARCPEPKRLAPGVSLPAALGLSSEACQYIWEDSTDMRPLFVLTNMGLGLLDKRYDRHAGVGLFLHIHGRPKALGRMINYGALGDPERAQFRVSEEIRALGTRVTARDEATYRSLAEARDILLAAPGAVYLNTDERGRVYRYELWKQTERMAAFAGCCLHLPEELAPKRVCCYRPMLTEAILRCALSEVAMVARNGEAECRISTLDDQEDGGLVMSLRYEMEATVAESELYRQVESARRRWALHSEVGGMDISAELEFPTRSEMRKGGLPTVCLTMEWLRDPTLLTSSDLKAGIRMRYE